MPRYRFDLYNSIGFVPDEQGRDLPDLDSACSEGIKGARSLLADDVLKGRLDLRGRLEVFDDNGALVLTIRFADAIEVVT